MRELRLIVHYLLENIAGVAQLARASAFQAEGRGFESRFPLDKIHKYAFGYSVKYMESRCSSEVEHFLGKEEVTGSIPVIGSTISVQLITK